MKSSAWFTGDDGAPPTPRTPKPPAVFAAERAETDVQTRALRLRAATEALEKARMFATAEVLRNNPTAEWIAECRNSVIEVRRSIQDGTDEPRYAACNVALEALGRPWACP